MATSGITRPQDIVVKSIECYNRLIIDRNCNLSVPRALVDNELHVGIGGNVIMPATNVSFALATLDFTGAIIGNLSVQNTVNADTGCFELTQTDTIEPKTIGGNVTVNGNVCINGDFEVKGSLIGAFSIFRVDSTTPQAVVSGIVTKLVLDVQDTFNMNAGGTWNPPTNDTFTIADSGWYELSGDIAFLGSFFGDYGPQLYVNGVMRAAQHQYITPNISSAIAHVNCKVHLVAGDLVDLRALHTSGIIQNVTSAFLVVQRLGPF